MNLFELYNVLKDGQKGRNNFLVTVIQGNGTGSRYFLADGEVKAQCGSGDIETERLRELVQPGESGIAEADGRRLFVESLKQPAHLVICDSFENALKQIPGSEDTYFLIVTRGHRYDRVCLEAILKKPYAYVGMMASRGRSALLKKQMEEDGFDRKVLDEIHTPVGLDIHAETPEEIAVSIVSELIKEKNSVRKTSGYDAELLDYLTGEKEPDTKKALATIVARRGSAPRGIGTKMLVLEDGRIIGTIGGGCMESEVQHLCLRMLHEESAQGQIFTVDMTASQAEEEGLVCGGTIQVFMEVI